jgi:hypothetical protein
MIHLFDKGEKNFQSILHNVGQIDAIGGRRRNHSSSYGFQIIKNMKHNQLLSGCNVTTLGNSINHERSMEESY